MAQYLNFQNLDFEDWIKGFVSGFIQGGTNSLIAGFTVAVVVPGVHLSAVLASMGSVFLVSGILGGAAYLHTKPFPDTKEVTDKTTISGPPGGPALVVRSHEEKRTEPVIPEDKP